MVSFRSREDDAASALKRLLAKLKAQAEAAFLAARDKAPAKPTKAPDFSGVVMVLRRRDGFVRRDPCPRSGPPDIWCVPMPPRTKMSYSEADITISTTAIRFRRERWLSRVEVEYLEE